MTGKKIILAGGTGFVGSYLAEQFTKAGHEVYIISRQKNTIQWHDTDAIVKALDNSEMLINLAGKSVNCRYTDLNKDQILKSRTETTQILGEAILQCSHPPKLWINSSTATIYRHAEDRPMTESTGEIGSGFSVHVATEWEQTFFAFSLPNTRQVALRMAIVLGDTGGAMTPLINLVRLGLGGTQGNGKQMFSWIHIEDLFHIITYIHTHTELTGVYNCSSPNPVDNKTLMKTLRDAMHVPIGLPSPKFLLEIGALFIQTETELLLKSRWVLPERLLEAGYTFTHTTLDQTLKDIVAKK